MTGTRAEYGLLYWLIRGLQEAPDVELQLLVTGAHLSPEFGLTVREIERDGFPIAERIESLLAADSDVAVATSVGLGTIGCASALGRLRPDVLVLLGDRFEVLSAASAATMLRIPIAHIHGGESTEGAVDEAVRHAVTKMSHLHFVTAAPHRERVRQMGEEAARVFNVGAPGLDHVTHTPRLSREELESSLELELRPPLVLVTFHPATLEPGVAELQAGELLAALAGLDATLIFTYPNADTEGRFIARSFESFCLGHPRAKLFKSLGTSRYFSLMALADAMVGNSSSGLIEAASFRLPVVNVGERQRARLRAKNVIESAPERRAIASALAVAMSSSFRSSLDGLVNPYGDGNTAPRILDVLRRAELGAGLLKKRFVDLPVALEAEVR